MTGVDHLVSLQLIRLGKSLTAHITDKRFMTGVDHLVLLQVTSPGKSLMIYITDKRFMTGVNPLVFLQVTSLGKSLPAYITDKRFMARMDHLVCLQVLSLCKSFSAHITHLSPGTFHVSVTFPVTMVTSTTVRSVVVWRHSLQFLAMKRSHMYSQATELYKGSGAVLTLVGSVL